MHIVVSEPVRNGEFGTTKAHRSLATVIVLAFLVTVSPRITQLRVVMQGQNTVQKYEQGDGSGSKWSKSSFQVFLSLNDVRSRQTDSRI